MEAIEVDGQRVKVAAMVEARGWRCPMPIVRLRLKLETVEVHQVVELWADDPGIVEDLPAWCAETNNALLALERREEGVFVAYVEKGGQALRLSTK